MSQTEYQKVIDYHDRTKHHLHKSARAPGYMDWPNQPIPFRNYDDTYVVELPLTQSDSENSYINLYKRNNKLINELTKQTIAQFLELSLGLSAWKSVSDNQWALRINPSSGNLHPTEAYILIPELNDISAGVYHYNPYHHTLEERAELPKKLKATMNRYLQRDCFFIFLSSIYWREAWKYGERAFRYCNHDVGHALACLSFSSNLLGWKTSYLDGISDDELDIILGFSDCDWVQHEEEKADLVCAVHKNQSADFSEIFSTDMITDFSNLTFKGQPNRLSQDHFNWNIINEISLTTRKDKTRSDSIKLSSKPLDERVYPDLSASQIIRQRRSAQSYDKKTSLTKDQLLHILDKTLPRDHCAPFDLYLIEPSIHFLIFVHRVDSLEAGLYFFIRNDNELDDIKSATHSSFKWNKVYDNLALYLLEQGNYQNHAIQISCQQEIAGNSAFSLGMIARFQPNIEKSPHYYRQLFWESGMIGQVLYLEAEAHGLRGTGIGCFFDDSVHDLLGLKDHQYQSLYHFTVGGSVEDNRLKTLSPYDHLDNQRLTDHG